MGIARANEVLMFGKKQTAQDLLDCKFVKCDPISLSLNFLTYAFSSKIFPKQSVESFHAAVRAHVQSELESLDLSAVLEVKKLIKSGLEESNNSDAANLRESYAQSARMASGVPRERFRKIARKELKHKL